MRVYYSLPQLVCTVVMIWTVMSPCHAPLIDAGVQVAQTSSGLGCKQRDIQAYMVTLQSHMGAALHNDRSQS
jgi:hypothetical protein